MTSATHMVGNLGWEILRRLLFVGVVRLVRLDVGVQPWCGVQPHIVRLDAPCVRLDLGCTMCAPRCLKVRLDVGVQPYGFVGVVRLTKLNSDI